jgi:hypothetical protein
MTTNQYNVGDRIDTVQYGVNGTVQKVLAKGHYKVLLDQEVIVGYASGLRLRTLNLFGWEMDRA